MRDLRARSAPASFIPAARFLPLLGALLLAACAEPDRPAPTTAPPAVLTPRPFPADGRVIVEAREYPWSALGRVNTGGRGYCTGILISPSHVLASAPCLYNRIEGRWWHKSEVHFVAGYQRDRYLADSPVRAYQKAPAYDPRAGATLGNIANTWALITLSKPIGRETGWLGLQALEHPQDRGQHRNQEAQCADQGDESPGRPGLPAEWPG